MAVGSYGNMPATTTAGAGAAATDKWAGGLPGAKKVAGQIQGLVGGIPGQDLGQQYLPKFQQGAAALGGLAGGKQARGLVQGANRGAAMGKDTAQDIYGYAQGLIPYGQQIGEMGFDPQQALYNRTLQQVQDQQRAGQSARGIGMSPYGAGLEGDATRNFNIDWQNQQLKRATDAATAMEGLGSSAFNLGTGATDLAAKSGAMPYQAKQGLMQDRISAYANVGNQVTGANQPRQQAISDFLSYLGMGPGYQNAAASQQNANSGSIGAIAGPLMSLIGK